MNNKRKLALILSFILAFNTQSMAAYGAEAVSPDAVSDNKSVSEEMLSEEISSGNEAVREDVNDEVSANEGGTVSEDSDNAVSENANDTEEEPAGAGGTYSIADGDIYVSMNSSGEQTVKVGSSAAVEDADPVITGSTDQYVLVITAEGDKKAKVTFRGLTIDNQNDLAGRAAVTADCNVEIELDGENILKSYSAGGKAGLQHENCNDDRILTINDSNTTQGSLNSTGAAGGAGIGGGNNGAGSNITINGGEVTATGGIGGAGIGGGNNGAGSNITINDGEVTATGRSGGVGIGGGDNGAGSNITINDGKVIATGGLNGAGIGGGDQGEGKDITINEGEVTATGDVGGAGIGGGNGGSGSNITINEGKVAATGDSGGAGIGGGNGGSGSNITINEGKVAATGASGGAGIGGGFGGAGSNITINEGEITATGDLGGAGIGGGNNGAGSNITINEGEVTATGGDLGGAGIGGGSGGAGSNITISGNALVSAAGGYASGFSGAAIGNGGSTGPGAEVDPDISGLTTGLIFYYAAGTTAEAISKGTATPVKIVAKTFTVNFDCAGGTAIPPLNYNVLSSDLIPAPVKGEKKFEGWKVTTASGNWTAGEIIPAGTSVKGRWGNVTLTAQWEADPGPGPDPGKKTGIWIKGIKKDGYPYTGSSIRPQISVYYDGELLTEKTDYTVKYGKNTAVGNGTITVAGKGNFKDKQTVSFNIIKADLKNAKVYEDVVESYKKGKKHNKVHPALYMNGTKLKFGKKDLTYTYLDASGSVSDCEPEGKYTIRISANESCANYTGGIDIPMLVTSIPGISKAKVKVKKASVKYTGKKITPQFSVTLKGKTLAEGTDYKVIYDPDDDYICPGIHYATLQGNGEDYLGQKKVGFTVTGKYDLSDKDYVKVTVDKDGCRYMKGGARPKVSVTYKDTVLTEGKDYTVKYTGNKKAGEKAVVTVIGKGSYSGKAGAEFDVTKCDIKDLVINVSDRAESAKKDDYKKAVITITDENGKDQKLKKDKDYTAVFPEYDKAPVSGQSIEVTITGSGDNYTGTAKATYRIKDAKKDIAKAKIKIHAGKPYDYTGKKITPSANDISISLNKARVPDDGYVIKACYNNVKRGKATLIIKGIGSYYGEKKVTFSIGAAKLNDIWGGIMRSIRGRFSD